MRANLPRLLIAAGFALGSAVILSARPPVDIDAALKQWLADKPGGVTAAWIDAEGVTFFAAGKVSAADPRPVTADTEFEIGSLTKVFTALLLEDAVQAGKISLDVPVGPPFDRSAVTYRQLATHTSGLPRMAADFSAADPLDPYADETLDMLVRSFRAAAPNARPGAFAYSNFGFAVLGHAVAGAWGRPYGDLLRERILEPLGLHDTWISWRNADQTRLAPGHDDAGPAHSWNSGAYAPAGAIVSTARDLARFVQDNLGLVDTPLAATLVETMKPQADRPGKAKQIGLAWHIEPHRGGTAIWHNGLTGGYHSFLAFDVAKKQGIVLLTNHAAGLEPLGVALLDGRMPAVSSVTATPPAVALTAAELEDYVGHYQLGQATFTLTRDGERLLAQLTGQPAVQIYPSAKDEFFYKVVNAQLSFVRGGDGNVIALILHQNGRDQRAERVP